MKISFGSLGAVTKIFHLRYGKRATTKNATHLATLQQKDLIATCNKSGIRLNVGGKTRNIAIQLVLQHCCKTRYTVLLPVLPIQALVFTAPFIGMCR